MKSHSDYKFQTEVVIIIRCPQARKGYDEDSFVPIVCTFWRTGDYPRIQQHEPVAPELGFHLLSFPTVDFPTFLWVLSSCHRFGYRGAPWILDALSLFGVYTKGMFL